MYKSIFYPGVVDERSSQWNILKMSALKSSVLINLQSYGPGTVSECDNGVCFLPWGLPSYPGVESSHGWGRTIPNAVIMKPNWGGGIIEQYYVFHLKWFLSSSAGVWKRDPWSYFEWEAGWDSEGDHAGDLYKLRWSQFCCSTVRCERIWTCGERRGQRKRGRKWKWKERSKRCSRRRWWLRKKREGISLSVYSHHIWKELRATIYYRCLERLERATSTLQGCKVNLLEPVQSKWIQPKTFIIEEWGSESGRASSRQSQACSCQEAALHSVQVALIFLKKNQSPQHVLAVHTETFFSIIKYPYPSKFFQIDSGLQSKAWPSEGLCCESTQGRCESVWLLRKWWSGLF